jgi:hypothetical protein
MEIGLGSRPQQFPPINIERNWVSYPKTSPWKLTDSGPPQKPLHDPIEPTRTTRNSKTPQWTPGEPPSLTCFYENRLQCPLPQTRSFKAGLVLSDFLSVLSRSLNDLRPHRRGGFRLPDAIFLNAPLTESRRRL